MFSNTSTFNHDVDLAFAIIIGISLIFLIGITFTIIYFSIRFSRKKNPKPKDIKDNMKLEVTWIVIPTILVLVMFWFGYAGYSPMRNVPKGAINIKVTGMMWAWIFDYDNGKTSNGNLVVPVGKPIKLDLYSPDVNHSLYIPAFRVKEDVVPGKNNWMWFQANEEGEYDILCAEYCGTRHAYMLGKVKVVSLEEYSKWYNDVEAPDESEPAGLTVIKKNACAACHSLDGTKLVGPSFKDLFGSERKVLVDGETKTVTADAEYIKRSIYQPNAEVVEGFNPGLMMSYKDKIAEEEIADIVSYFESISQ